MYYSTHGAIKKRCCVEGCDNGAVKLCGMYTYCRQCTHIVVKSGVCISHGANVKRCSIEGCTNIDVKGGVVTRNQCSFEGCTKYVQKSEVCTTHMAQKVTRKQMQRCWMYQSSTEGRNLYYTWRETKAGAALMGCPNKVKKGGVCVTHGARKKQCRVVGCTNQAKKGGVCKPHGAYCKLRVVVCSSFEE